LSTLCRMIAVLAKSTFIKSGHSNPANFAILNGCFRPEAVVRGRAILGQEWSDDENYYENRNDRKH
jgi:hypothetical protein